MPVRLIEFFPLLAFETKAFIREALAQGLAVPKPADAMHMVTAKEIDAVEVHTYDIEGNRAWPRYQPLVGVRIGEPNAPNLQYTLEFIARPPMREQVPDGPEEHPAPPN